ncbi:MAG TPA: hypothetical protein PK109_00095 [Candidatus Paceibacterota bacterium]|nr:hypothetical protein [Candidatus Paceibacterota bacterium]
METIYLAFTTLLTRLYIFVMEVLEVIHEWQDFYGALLAAGVAIILFILTEWAKERKERQDQTFRLHRSIGAALSNLTEIDSTLTHFSNNQLARIISQTEHDISNGQPTIRYAFVPLLHVAEIPEELLKQSSGSGYVDALTIDLVNKSKDLRKIIDDINRQFEASILLNNHIAMNRLNPDPRVQSRAFKVNMEEFRSKMIERDLRNNIQIYASQLIKAQTAVSKLQDWGLKKWKKSFNHFNGRDMYERMDNYFTNDVSLRKVAYQEVFQTPICVTILN